MLIVRTHPSGTEAKPRHLAGSFPGAAVWYRGWSLLSRREKRLSFFVLGMMILAAASSTVMVSAIFPFLSIIANPDVIQENERLRLIHEYAGFSSRYHFLVATGLAAAVVIVVTNAIQVLNLYVMSRFFLMRVHGLSLRLLEEILHRPYEFQLHQHTGNMSRTVLDEAQQVVNRFFLPAGELMASTITIIYMLAGFSVCRRAAHNDCQPCGHWRQLWHDLCSEPGLCRPAWPKTPRRKWPQVCRRRGSLGRKQGHEAARAGDVLPRALSRTVMGGSKIAGGIAGGVRFTALSGSGGRFRWNHCPLPCDDRSAVFPDRYRTERNRSGSGHVRGRRTAPAAGDTKGFRRRNQYAIRRRGGRQCPCAT